MTNVKWFRVLKTYEKPHGGFLAHGRVMRACCRTTASPYSSPHPGDPRWHEVVDVAHLEEEPDPPAPRRRRR